MASQRPARQPPPGMQMSTNAYMRPPVTTYPSSGSVTFQPMERGDRAAPIQSSRYSLQQIPTKDQPLPPTPTKDMMDEDDIILGTQLGSKVGRKKSLVKPDREKIDPGHRLWHYRNQAAKLGDQGRVLPSSMIILIHVEFTFH